MWLINTTTLRLQGFTTPSKRKYAILSHMWEDEEVSFQAFADLGNAGKLKGFAKIERTCEEAKSRGLEFAWVDTCCIDKSSSAELSEVRNFLTRSIDSAAYPEQGDQLHVPVVQRLRRVLRLPFGPVDW